MEKRDVVTGALESFLKILNKRTGRTAAAPEGPRDGLLVLIRKKKKKKAALPGEVAGAVKAEAAKE